jgi:hypothetical protein
MSKVMYLLPITTNGQMLEPANYDWQDKLPSPFNAAQLKAAADYREQTYELQYRSLKSAMAPSKAELAITAKQFRLGLSEQVHAANEASNRPDAIPADMSVLKGETIIGIASCEAWRNAESHKIAIHQPLPLPTYKAPTREHTASEKAVAEWLAQDRQIKPMGRSSRLARLQARFWNAGDGKAGHQPVDPRNAELRSLRLQAAQ